MHENGWRRPAGLALAAILIVGTLLWMMGVATAQQPLGGGAAVDSRISYQGTLAEGGIPVTGSRNMIFRIFSDGACTTQVGVDIPKPGVLVSKGYFDVGVDVDPTAFDGQALWLGVWVSGTAIACQEVLPTPYALSVRPGAVVSGDATAGDGWVLRANMTGTYPVAAALDGKAATGSAVRGSSINGNGVYGYTETGYAVRGYDAGSDPARGYAGYFTSENGVAVYASTASTSHYVHGGIFQGNMGYGLYAHSAQNNAVRAIGGNESDLSYVAQPGGVVGLVGLSGTRTGVWGSSRDASGVAGYSQTSAGVYGESVNGHGVEGRGTNDYAGYFYSSGWRALYASSAPSWYAGYLENRGGSLQAGLYVDGTLLVTGSKSGYVVDIAVNDGPDSLETGDLVVVNGVDSPLIGEIPLMRVRKATEAGTTALAGVVDQPFEVAVASEQGPHVPQPSAGRATLGAGTGIGTGKYLSVVTLGAFKAIKVDSSGGPIRPGDLLAASATAGRAARAANPGVGAVIGKAMAAFDGGSGVIPVLVTLR
jgi:hypothetical protein